MTIPQKRTRHLHVRGYVSLFLMNVELSHMPLLKSFAIEICGMCTGIWLTFTKTIFWESEFHWNGSMTIFFIYHQPQCWLKQALLYIIFLTLWNWPLVIFAGIVFSKRTINRNQEKILWQKIFWPQKSPTLKKWKKKMTRNFRILKSFDIWILEHSGRLFPILKRISKNFLLKFFEGFEDSLTINLRRIPKLQRPIIKKWSSGIAMSVRKS